ncbi:MAG: type II toxin-antitoxin system prevent-host-death family antitoxin [Actinobacteria bacterium ATB1]|nr:type II toxin-antitoxin system prevent-host-death family antitoxin [Actinobacteria bacterium ATB1]
MERTVPATEFKTHALRYLDLAEAGEVIIVSKHGRAVAKLVPLGPKESGRPLRGCMHVVDAGDDLDLGEDWEAERGTWEPA